MSEIEVSLSRAEGPHDMCYQDRRFTSLSEATAWLNRHQYSFPEEGNGYDKHDCYLLWKEDGSMLKVRLDKTQAFLSIKMYLIDYMRFLAGKRCPYYLTPEKYQQVVEQYDFVEGAEVWIKRLEEIE